MNIINIRTLSLYREAKVAFLYPNVYETNKQKGISKTSLGNVGTNPGNNITTIKRLPIPYFQKGLAQKQRHPHNHISHSRVLEVFAHQLKWYLHDHSKEEVQRQLSEHDGTYQFMRDSGDHKGSQSRNSAPPPLRCQRLAPISVYL